VNKYISRYNSLQSSSSFETRTNFCSVFIIIASDLQAAWHQQPKQKKSKPHLPVEDPVLFIDIGNIALGLIEAFAREFATLINAVEFKLNVWKEVYKNILLIDLAYDTINRFLTGFIITIKQR